MDSGPSKKIAIWVVLFFVLIIAVVAFYFFALKKPKNYEVEETKTLEQMKQEVRNYKPNPETARDPVLLKQELSEYVPPPRIDGPTQAEMLEQLRNYKKPE